MVTPFHHQPQKDPAMSMKFVKVVNVYPRQIAIQTESGVSAPVPEKDRPQLEILIEQAVLDRDLKGYIDTNGQFKRVE